MRFARGDGYELMLFENEPVDAFFPTGLIMPITGSGVVLGDPVVAVPIGWSAEIIGRVRVRAGKDETFVIALEHGGGMPNAPGRVQVSKIVKHAKIWGFENEASSTRKVIQLKYLEVHEGHRTSLQYHEQKDEIILHLKDSGPSVPMYIPPKQVHRVSGPRAYVEASTYHPDDVVRLEDDYGRATVGTSDGTP